MILGLAALAAAMQAEGAAARPPYFPASQTEPRLICDAMRPDQRIPALTDSRVAYFSRHLGAADEPSLAPAEPRAKGAAREVIRFTWLRSFDAPVTVRVETSGKTAKLVAKTLSGRGGYAPGTIVQTAERPLTEAEARQLKALIKASDLDSLPARQCDQALSTDGANWLFEHVGAEGYHLVDRRNPHEGRLRDLGLFLIGLTGWTFERVY